MNVNFSDTEKKIQKLFSEDTKFSFNGITYKVILSGKPTCSKGEPKTDVYVRLKDINNNVERELKISIKQSNADFLENKITAERAQSILGANWENIIKESTLNIKNKFEEKPLIYKVKKGRTNKGSITLGWKFELVNKPSGELSGKISLEEKQIIDIYSGNNLPDDKKNSFVNGKKIDNSGIANFILIGNFEDFNDINSVLTNLVTINDYAKNNPDIYFACKALNYRTFEKKFDGDRPLSVFVDWKANKGKLEPTIKFDSPLITGGKQVAENLLTALNELHINTTNDICNNHIDLNKYAYL